MKDHEGLKSTISSGHYWGKATARSSILGEYSKAYGQIVVSDRRSNVGLILFRYRSCADVTKNIHFYSELRAFPRSAARVKITHRDHKKRDYGGTK